MRLKERGQALLEILVSGAFVLVPTLFMLIYMGKVGDLQHRAHEAARYAAWEGVSTKKSPLEIDNEINKRILYGVYQEYDSEEDRKKSNLDKDRIDPLYFYSDEGKYESVLVVKEDSFSKSSRNSTSPESELHGVRQAALDNGIVGFDLEENGIQSASVGIKIKETSRLVIKDGIEVKSKNNLYSEAWRKTTRRSLVGAVEGSIFGEKAFDNAVFDNMATLAEKIGFEEWGGFDPGHIEKDVVPCSRVLGGGNDRESACN